MKLKHKSKIQGKENSDTNYYYEIKLHGSFKEDKEMKAVLDFKKLFDLGDDKSQQMIKQYLPAITTWDKLIISKKDY